MYDKTLIWEGPCPRSIPELLGSGSQIEAVLFVLKLSSTRIQNLKTLGWKMAKKNRRQTDGHGLWTEYALEKL
jgi:hypothetical protein